MVRQKLFHATKKNTTRIMAIALSMAMAGGMVPMGMIPAIQNVKAEVTQIQDDFETENKQGVPKGSPELSLVEDSHGGKTALQVTGRNEDWFAYAYDVTAFAGKTINLDAYMKVDSDSLLVAAVIEHVVDGETKYDWITSAQTKMGEWVELKKEYTMPNGAKSVYFVTHDGEQSKGTKDDYLLDDVTITSVEGKEGNTAYVDITGYDSLKDLYEGRFKIGVASEALSHWGGYNPLNEIGNPAKEALIKQEFNSLTFGNELKPDCNMGYQDKSATETDLPFVIDESAKEMLDWAKNNHIPVRGHVLVWHSQCPDAVFCKGYNPVYKDAEKKVLDPSCYVDKETMLKRLESYINHTMKYMYENGYGDTIYAWDVVNEAVEPGTNEYNLRNSYWYQIMGTDFMYYSFKYAREASIRYSKEYAALYDMRADDDDEALKAIQPKLFYNDYNEYQQEKCDAIIDILTKKYNGHSIKEEGLIDGVGMQSHVADTTKLDTYLEALHRYSEAIGEVHITELDVAQTSTGVNADYYQAVFYNELFKALIEAVKRGVNLTSVTIWGLTDDNSWKKDSSPLLFRSDLSKKMAFDGIVNAITGKPMPEPAYIKPDFSDMNMDFEDGTVQGFGTRGDGSLLVQGDVVLDGKAALLDSGRTANWNGTNFDVSRFIGQTIAISAWVKSNADTVGISADIDQLWPNIAKVSTKSGEWVQIKGIYKVPSDMTSLKLYFEASDESDIFIDHVKVKLVGLEEGFEETQNIAKARGVGHMPQITVTNEQSHTANGHSLKVKREAQEASMSFDVSKYIGQTVDVKAFVKTTDAKIKLGLDGSSPVLIKETDAQADGWTEVNATYTIPNTLTSANFYLETDGTADFYVDDISVTLGDYKDDVETELQFGTRWDGAGEIARVEEKSGNHVVVMSNRDANYVGPVFDVTPFLGSEVEISLDVKTDDKLIRLTGDIDNVWPNYANVASKPGEFTKVRATVKLPSNLTSLRLYIETDGTSDIYVDNLTVKRVAITDECSVRFDGNGLESVNACKVVTKGENLQAPNVDVPEGYEFIGWYKDAKTTEPWNFLSDKVMENTVLYAKWKEVAVPIVIPTPSTNPSEKPIPSTEPSVSPTPSVQPSKEPVHEVILDMSKRDSLLVKAIEIKKYLMKGEDVTFSILDKNGKEVCVWTFFASNCSASFTWNDIKLDVVIKPGKSVGYTAGTYIEMKQKGKLPTEAKVKVKAESKFKSGTKLYLYRVDAKTKKLYCMPNSCYKVDKEGFVSLNVIAGANYVLLPSVADNEKKVGITAQIRTAKDTTMKKGRKKSVAAVLPDTVVKMNSFEGFKASKHKAVYGAVVTYKSNNVTVATVSKDGKVSARGKGKTKITTTIQLSNGVTKTYKNVITVK